MPVHFTLAEIKDLPDVPATVDTDRVDAIEADLVGTIEREIGHPLAPATVTARVVAGTAWAVVLPHADLTALTAVAWPDSGTQDPADYATEYGILTLASGADPGWAVGDAVTVTYTHGPWASCPPDLREPLLWAIRDRILSGSANAGPEARRTSITTEYGTTNFVIPGEARPTGYPALDAAIAGHVRTSVGDFA